MPGCQLKRLGWGLSGGQRQIGESKDDGFEFLGSVSVDGSHRKAVHVAAVEPGNVDGGNHVLAQDPARSSVE